MSVRVWRDELFDDEHESKAEQKGQRDLRRWYGSRIRASHRFDSSARGRLDSAVWPRMKWYTLWYDNAQRSTKQQTGSQGREAL